MSQVVPTCDPLFIVIDGNERVRCHSGGVSMWETIPIEEMTSIWQPLSIPEALVITSAILATWAIAFGVNFVFKQVMANRPGRY